jgi:hypothetical protein
MISTVKEHTFGLTKECTLELGRRIKCMVRVKQFGKMDENSLEYVYFIHFRNTKTIKDMGRVSLNGLTGGSTLALGLVVIMMV